MHFVDEKNLEDTTTTTYLTRGIDGCLLRGSGAGQRR